MVISILGVYTLSFTTLMPGEAKCLGLSSHIERARWRGEELRPSVSKSMSN